MRSSTVVLIGLLLFSGCDKPETPGISATVGRVVDGDTVHVVLSGRDTTVRLAGCVDAPESSQPGGHQAKQALVDLLQAKPIIVTVRDQDKYGRAVASISAGGVDVSNEMVLRGWAWIYPNCRDVPAVPQSVEVNARRQRRGLWSAKEQAKEPWLWRKDHTRGNGYAG